PGAACAGARAGRPRTAWPDPRGAAQWRTPSCRCMLVPIPRPSARAHLPSPAPRAAGSASPPSMAEPMPPQVLTALLVLPLALAAGPARAAAIHGDVSLAKGHAARDAVVWLEQVPDKVERRLVSGGRRWFWQRAQPPRGTATVLEVGRRFDPRVLAVA